MKRRDRSACCEDYAQVRLLIPNDGKLPRVVLLTGNGAIPPIGSVRHLQTNPLGALIATVIQYRWIDTQLRETFYTFKADTFPHFICDLDTSYLNGTTRMPGSVKILTQ